MTQTATATTHEAVTGHDADPERESLRAENSRLQAELEQATARHDAFLATMSARAKEVATENDWCGVARDLVEELGGTWPEDSRDYTMHITRTWTISAEASPSAYIDSAYIIESLTTGEDGPPGLNDDWTDVRVTSDSGFTVSDYEQDE